MHPAVEEKRSSKHSERRADQRQLHEFIPGRAIHQERFIEQENANEKPNSHEDKFCEGIEHFGPNSPDTNRRAEVFCIYVGEDVYQA